MGRKSEHLTIVIGADFDADFDELVSGKPLSEIHQPRNALYLDSFEELFRLLSPAKLDVLKHLIKTQGSKKPKSVSQIAVELHRHQEAISRDISQLKRLGLVEARKEKQTVYAKAKVKKINIKLC